MSRRYTFEEIENWIKNNKPKFTLLDFEYRKNACYIHIKCDNENHKSLWKPFKSFKEQVHGCRECGFESRKSQIPVNKPDYKYVKSFIENYGCKLLSETYKDNSSHLEIECKCGRVFKRTFEKFKNSKRHYCSICTGGKTFVKEEVLKELDEVYHIRPKNEIDISKNAYQIFICNDCGNEIRTCLRIIMKQKIQPCYKCNLDYIEFSYEGVKYYIETHSDCKLISTKYINNNAKMKLICPCGDIFETTFNRIKNRNKIRCNKCNGSKILTYEEVREVIEENGSILLTSKTEYKNTKEYLKIKCVECGEIYYRNYTCFINNVYKSCMACSFKLNGKAQRYTHEYVANFIKDNGAELLSQYVKSNQYIEIRCSCGEIFTTTFNDFNSTNKRRCNKCSGVISNGEKYFTDWLEANKIKYDFQKTFEDCKNLTYLPFDFYIESKNIAIEIDGFLHRDFNEFYHKTYDNFLKVQYRDSIKTNYCEENGIKLFRIKYDSMKDIEDWIETYKEIICN